MICLLHFIFVGVSRRLLPFATLRSPGYEPLRLSDACDGVKTAANRCRIVGDAARPAVCGSLLTPAEMCGYDPDPTTTRTYAMTYLCSLEARTR